MLFFSSWQMATKTKNKTAVSQNSQKKRPKKTFRGTRLFIELLRLHYEVSEEIPEKVPKIFLSSLAGHIVGI